jgi:hypothetical protein
LYTIAHAEKNTKRSEQFNDYYTIVPYQFFGGLNLTGCPGTVFATLSGLDGEVTNWRPAAHWLPLVAVY